MTNRPPADVGGTQNWLRFVNHLADAVLASFCKQALLARGKSRTAGLAHSHRITARWRDGDVDVDVDVERRRHFLACAKALNALELVEATQERILELGFITRKPALQHINDLQRIVSAFPVVRQSLDR